MTWQGLFEFVDEFAAGPPNPLAVCNGTVPQANQVRLSTLKCHEPNNYLASRDFDSVGPFARQSQMSSGKSDRQSKSQSSSFSAK